MPIPIPLVEIRKMKKINKKKETTKKKKRMTRICRHQKIF